MSVKKNFLYNILYQILIILLPLITTPYISRVIGAGGVGVYSYTFSIANYFVIIAMLGINNHGSRSIARVRDNKNELDETFSSILLFHLAISVIAVLAYSIFLIFFDMDNKNILWIQFLYVLSALFDINWFFFGIEQFKLTVTRNTIIKLLSVISIFIFVKEKNDLWIYTLILAGGNLISQCLLWPFLKNYVTFKKCNIKSILRHLKPCAILFIPVIAVSIYKVMDKIMIGSISNMTQLGFYENSEKIIGIPLGIITALGTVMVPKMSNLKSKGLEEESKKYISVSMVFVMLISIGAIWGLIAIAPILIPIFLGKEYTECVLIVSLLSITIMFIAWANVIRTQFIIPNRMDKTQVISTTLGAIVNLIINLLLIKRYGAIGATVGTIFAEFTVAAYVTYVVRKKLPIRKYSKECIPFIITGGIMFLFIRVIGMIFKSDGILVGIAQIVIGGSIYMSINYFYLVRKDNEIGNQLKIMTANIIKKIKKHN